MQTLSFIRENEISVKDDYVCAYENEEDFDKITGCSDLKEGEDYTLNQMTIKGINQFDGSNWITIEIENEAGTNDYDLLDDSELEKELNEAIKNCSFRSEGGGITNYTSGNYFIHTSQWQGSFGSYYFTDENTPV